MSKSRLETAQGSQFRTSVTLLLIFTPLLSISTIYFTFLPSLKISFPYVDNSFWILFHSFCREGHSDQPPPHHRITPWQTLSLSSAIALIFFVCQYWWKSSSQFVAPATWSPSSSCRLHRRPISSAPFHSQQGPFLLSRVPSRQDPPAFFFLFLVIVLVLSPLSYSRPMRPSSPCLLQIFLINCRLFYYTWYFSLKCNQMSYQFLNLFSHLLNDF